MLINKIYFKIINHINRILQIAKKERLCSATSQLIFSLLYIFEGKFFAFLVGWKHSYLGRGSRIIGTRFINVGDRVTIGRNAWIEAVIENGSDTFHPVIKIGNSCNASERLHISAINCIEIKNDCLFGSGVFICDHNHGSYKGEIHSHPSVPPVLRKLVSHGPVYIGTKVWVGDNVTIIGPVKIGNGSVIAANSVVTHDVPENVIIAGVPAKVIKRFDPVSGSWI